MLSMGITLGISTERDIASNIGITFIYFKKVRFFGVFLQIKITTNKNNQRKSCRDKRYHAPMHKAQQPTKKQRR